MSQNFKHSELTFQLIVESSPVAQVLVNKEGKIAYINHRTEILFGYLKSELIGQLVEVLIPRRYHGNHNRFRDSFFDSPSARSMGTGRELFAVRKDETEFPVEIGLNPIVTVDGTMVLASIINISERKNAEERFRLMVEAAPNAMVLVNDEGIIKLINVQTEKLFGYNRDELIGNKLELLIPHRFKNVHRDHTSTFFKIPQARPMGVGRHLSGLRKDGSEILIEIGLNPIEMEEGMNVLASIIDITERQAQELIIKKQLAELELKNKELEQFTYIASHDLQEPLRTVTNFLQLFEEDYSEKFDENAFKYLNSIGRAAKRMSTLVRALLDFSRLGKGKQLTVFDCKTVIDDVISDLAVLISESGAKIEVGEMPKLNAYETEIHQLFQNLISNAIKFQKTGSKPEITIKAKKAEAKWEFSIRDNGIGIAPEHFDRVFNIFQRLDHDEKYEGNGIGLANCKKIVQLHGGKIWIESVFGEGTTFHFTL